MTIAESVEDILRPLADLRCFYPHKATDPELDLDASLDAKCPECHGTFLDPRLEALRLKQEKLALSPEEWGRSRTWPVEWRGSIDASMGAIVRAIGACGLVVTFLSASGLAQIDSLTYRSHGPMRWREDGDTPEEGLARAFVAAWKAESKA